MSHRKKTRTPSRPILDGQVRSSCSTRTWHHSPTFITHNYKRYAWDMIKVQDVNMLDKESINVGLIAYSDVEKFLIKLINNSQKKSCCSHENDLLKQNFIEKIELPISKEIWVQFASTRKQRNNFLGYV